MSHAKITGWNVELEPLDSKVAALKAESVRRPASVFCQALHDLDDVSLVPFLAAGEGISLFYWSIGYVHGPISSATKVLRGEAKDLEELTQWDTREDRIKAADHWIAHHFRDPDKTKELAEFIDRMMDRLCSKASFRRALESMNAMAATALWTSLECLARDLWISSLNESSVSVVHRAFKLLESEEVARKSVSISDLAKHGFDIRHRVGTLLASKYVFSDTEGITRAFQVFSERGVQIESAVRAHVRRLEKTRHLLVHRGGVVDAKFKRETSCLEEEGTQIQVDADTMRTWFAACISFGGALIELAEQGHANPD